jgi:hypothetical protein
VEASSWPALLAVAATAGIFAVAGAEITHLVLGGAYGDDVGAEIGRLVVALAPYMVASLALSVTLPLVFVSGRGGRLPLVGLGVLAIHVPLAFAGQALAGLEGLALALAVSTGIAFAWMLGLLDAVRSTLERLVPALAIVGGCALVGFVPAGAVLGPSRPCTRLRCATLRTAYPPTDARAPLSRPTCRGTWRCRSPRPAG